jgi:two-component system, cell cycle response regulator
MKTLETLKLNGQLPSPKGVALAILDICRREDATTTDIARIVQTDPALSGRLILQANSAANGGRSVASVPEAILRVGLGAVRHLTLGFSLVDQNLNGPCRAFDYQRFWSHSLLMALAMKRFGGLCRAGVPDELFACGLMAHIGCLGLATIYPVEYAGIIEQRSSAENQVELERKLLQADHNELTAALLIDWGIPRALVEPVYFHETPAASGFAEGSRPYQLVHLFYLAKRLADLGLAPEVERSGRISELMLLGGKIGLDADDLGAMVDELVKQWREWGALLKVPASALPAFSEMAVAPKSSDETSPAALRVLLVDDDPTALTLMKGLLGDLLGHTVFTATQGQEALALAVEVMPQVVVTDWLMPVMDGLELCRALRATEWGQAMYIIMLTGVDDEDEILKAFEVGVDDYVTKPVNVRALRARLRAAWHYVKLLEAWDRDRIQLKQFAAELAISNRRLEHVALTDLLTNLPNRRSGMKELDQAWQASNRSGQPLAMLMIDIDHFKKVNDNHGHAVGDIVLKEVAKAIQVSARRDDSICRLGGEEFVVICRNTDLKSALQAAERLRKVISVLKIRIGVAEVRTTVSIGVAYKDSDMPDVDALVNAADKALYGAKNAGRDRTCAMAQGKLLCGNHPLPKQTAY